MNISKPAVSGQGFERKSLAAMAAVGAALIFAGPAQADFIGAYDVANWTPVTTNSSGNINTAGAPASILITGNDNGLNDINTDFIIAAVTAGTVEFDWSYSSGDSGFWDQGGYLLNGVFNFLAQNDSQGSGSASFAVAAGDIFGFRVHSVDGIVGPGFLSISNFDAPAGQVPVPSTLLLLAAGVVGGLALRRRREPGEVTSH